MIERRQGMMYLPPLVQLGGVYEDGSALSGEDIGSRLPGRLRVGLRPPLCGFMAAVVVIGAWSAQGGEAPRKWAVIIGAGRYQDSGIGNLPNAVRDATALREALVSAPNGFSKDDVVLVVDDASDTKFRPTRANIVSIIETWAKKSGPEDTFLVYFAGHGLERNSRLYLVPTDAVLADIEKTTVPYEFFSRALKTSRAKRSIIILDACHSGTGRDAVKMTKDAVREIEQQAEGRVTLASCRENEVSRELDQHGAFTWFLLEGLKGKADTNGDGRISISELGQYTYNSVDEWASKAGNQQHPIVILSEVAGDIILADAPSMPNVPEPEMVEIPAGELLMGSSDAQLDYTEKIIAQYAGPELARQIRGILKDIEQPQHATAIKKFGLGKCAVTNGEYKAFVEETGCPPPTSEAWTGSAIRPGLEEHPVVNVSFADAEVHCAWLSRKTGKHYRLPTEAEWEYAAKGGVDRIFPWGDYWDPQLCNAGKMAGLKFMGDATSDGFLGTAPVKSFSPNAFGLYQMSGNILEWCADWFGPYKGTSDGKMRCVRGGGCQGPPDHQRAACRNAQPPDYRGPAIGFRVAYDVE